MGGFIAWLMMGTVYAEPQPGNPTTHEAQPNEELARAHLAEAVANYQTNLHGLAMQQFAALTVDTNAPPELRQEARIFLGEILYVQGDPDGAQRLFEQVLLENIEYQIDRFTHPPDVCGHFEYVRAYLVPTVSVEPVAMVVAPPPISAFAPFGVYHFRFNTRGRWPLIVGQTAFGLSSAALFVHLWRDHSYIEGDLQRQNQLFSLKAAQWSATFGYFGLWMYGSWDARRHWRINMAIQPAATHDDFPQLLLNARTAF